MGETVTFAGIAGTCASAGGCSVDVKDDVVTTNGDIVVVALAIGAIAESCVRRWKEGGVSW